MRSVYRLMVALAGVVTMACTAAAQDLRDNLGPLADVAELGADGAWRAEQQNGWFVLENRDDPSDILYYYLDRSPLRSGERRISLNTILRGDKSAAAGLMLDRRGPDNYAAFVVGGDGTVTVMMRTPEGMTPFDPAESHARLDGSDLLEVIETPGEARLILNGEELFTLSNEDGLAPSYGIIAIGSGRFGFDGFEIAESGAFPPPRDSGDPGDEGFPPPRDSDPGTGPAPAPDPQPEPEPEPEPEPRTGPPPSAQDIYAAKVLLGTTFGVFFHELGHALIGELNLPATGPEEDAADGFSALLVSEGVKEIDDPKDKEIAEGFAEYSSLVWYYSGLEAQKKGQTAPWQDEHAPDLKRFRNSFCLIYGSDPQRYADVAQTAGFEARTLDRCLQEYEKRYAAWEAILAMGARNLGPEMPGKHPADAPGGRVKLVMEPSESQVGQVIHQILKETGGMRDIAAELERTFVWPRDLTITFRDCRDVNAWYDPEAGSVTMCYQVIEFFSKIVFRAEGADAGDPATPGEPETPRQPDAQDAMAFFVGSWRAVVPTAQGSVTFTVSYDRNGRYRLTSSSPMGRIEEQGEWSARPAGEGLVIVENRPISWNPAQLCDQYGSCVPNQPQPGSVLVSILGRDTVSVEGVQWSRIQ